MPLLQGAIVIWSGSTLDIPNGWQLCDGTNGTPDLLNRFVIGAGDLYTVGEFGGSKDAILPEHTHTGVTSTSASHGHSSPSRVAATGGSGSANATATAGNTNTSSAGAHSHDTPTTMSTAGTGENGIGKNLPPYFALCYIQQL